MPEGLKYISVKEKEIELSFNYYKCLTPAAIAGGLLGVAEKLWDEAEAREWKEKKERIREERRGAWDAIGKLFWEK